MARSVECRACGQVHDPMLRACPPRIQIENAIPDDAAVRVLVQKELKRKAYMRRYMRDYRKQAKEERANVTESKTGRTAG